MDHAVRIGDEALFDRLAVRLKHHLDVGWDRVYGGLAHAVRVDRGGFVWPVERPLGTVVEFQAVGEYHYMKAFWALAEVLVATLKVLARRRAAWAADYFGLAQRVLDDRLSLAPLGHPLYTLFTGRRLTRGTGTGRAENYHHPRMLMLNVLALDRMIAGGEAPA
jgi:N-acylglucosamine 2-epimerase